MRRASCLIVLLAALYIGFVPNISKADLILDFSADGSTLGFTVMAGETIEVPVYLRQLSVAPPSPDITSDGLLFFGLTAELTGGSATFSDATAHSRFQFDFSSDTLTVADLAGSVDLGNPGVTGTAIELGTFTIQGSAIGGITTLTLFDTNPGMSVQDFLTESLAENFDADIFMPTASTTITTVPEPNSFILGLLGVVLNNLCTRKRKIIR